MRTEMINLLFAALTNFTIAFATALMAVMTTPGAGDLPTKGNVIVAVLGGLIAAGETIRQAMTATPERINTLRTMINKAPQPPHEDR